MREPASVATRPKGPGYYDNRRPDLVEMLPRPIGRVLDVGCGAGTVARQLREEGAERLVGIEPDPGAAAAAGGVCDEVLAMTAWLRSLTGTLPAEVTTSPELPR